MLPVATIAYKEGALVRFKHLPETVTAWYGALGVMVGVSSYCPNTVRVRMQTGPIVPGSTYEAALWQLEYVDPPRDNILGWFPRKPGILGAMEDEVPDVDWNPFE